VSAIRLDIAGDRATITLDNPDKRNALSVADIEAFAQALAEVHAAPGLRVLIVTGTGERAFCAGVSLSDVASQDWADNPLTALCDGLEQFPLPTIAALNGVVWGGGAEIALACDFRIGVSGMKVCVPPARLGIDYEPGGIARAMRRVGGQWARRMYMAAEVFDAETALRMNFVDRLVAPEALADEAAAMADDLAELAPLAVQGMKASIVALAENRLDPAEARARIAAAWESEDLQEGLAASREKRAPRFRGR
jgi:enoyl-CoA hydratase/carnithine racemase